MASKSRKQESKRARFQRLGASRTNQALKRLKILGNCSSKSLYEYTKDDVERMFAAIDRQFNRTKVRFDLPVDKEEFKL